MQQSGKVDGLLLISSVGGVNLNQLRVSDNLLETVNTYFAKVLAHLLSQEGEEVHHVF